MKPDEDVKLMLKLKESFKQQPTEELLNIWKKNDRYSYRDEAFTAIREILSFRNVNVPTQAEAIDSKQPKVVSAEKKENIRGAACVISGIVITALWYFSGTNYVVVPTGLIIYGLYILIKHQAIE